MYAKAKIIDDGKKEHDILTFGPVCVHPDFHNKGIGKLLINHTLKLAKEMNYRAIFILGYPEYYQKYGFEPAEKFDIATSDNKYLDALQVLELNKGSLDGIHGRFCEGEVYQVDDEKAKEFDKNFPVKEMLEGTASQQKFMEQVKKMKPRK